MAASYVTMNSPLSFPFLSFPFLSFPFLSFPFLSFPFLRQTRVVCVLLPPHAPRSSDQPRLLQRIVDMFAPSGFGWVPGVDTGAFTACTVVTQQGQRQRSKRRLLDLLSPRDKEVEGEHRACTPTGA